MTILFFDTETSDLPDYDSGPGRHQPHVVQLAAILLEGKDEQTLVTLIQPEGWGIHPEAQAKHGISVAKAKAHGIPIVQAVDKFDGMLRQASLVVAHNIRFDRLLMDSEYIRLRRRATWPRTFCTMVTCTDILRLPGRYGYKWPRLDETYRHFFGKPLLGTHDAMADVSACRAIFEELVARGLAPEG